MKLLPSCILATFIATFIAIASKNTYLFTLISESINNGIDSVTDASKTIVSFQNTNIHPDVTYSVTVQARDSNGDPINIGGDSFYLDVRNLCNWESLSECTPAGGQPEVVSGVSRTLMTDNGDGTYSGQYSVTEVGQITVSVFHYDRTPNEAVQIEYFD